MQFKLFGQLFKVNRVWLLITLTAFAILIKLSHWQWQRAAEKTLQLQQIAAIQQQGALSGHQLLAQGAAQLDGAMLVDTAYWLPPYIWLLDNQILNGRVGYDVIIPMQFADNSTLVLVNLGWLAAGDNRQLLPEPQIPAQLELEALVRSEPANTLLLGQNLEGSSYPMRMQQIDYALLQQQLPLSLYPAVLYQQRASDFMPHYQPVVMPPQKHRGYALQWFGLAVAVLMVALAASWHRENEHEQE
jgi:surfeit locus 1 family protein